MDTEISTLVEFVEEMCLRAETVAGADLGSAIRFRFPGLNLKVRFGGLRQFVQEHCGGRVVYVHAKGGDGIYAHVTKAPVEIQSAEGTTPRFTAWASLVDPNIDTHLAIDSASGSLHVLNEGIEVAAPLISVKKLSLEEHRDIAKGFLPELPDVSRKLFEDALIGDGFWRQWTAALKSLSDPSLYHKWIRWRQDGIMQLFDERLRSANLPEGLIPFAMAELQKSKEAQSSSKRNAPSAPKRFESNPRDFLSGQSAGDLSLRDLARSSINLMEDADIRRLWLPLGAVADALRSKR